MDAPFLSYLDLLRDLGASLDQLSQLAQEKMASVRQDDLIALDEVIKQEQAMSLNLRGLEQRRLKLMDQMELRGVPLDNLSGHYPKDLQLQAKPRRPCAAVTSSTAATPTRPAAPWS